MYILADRLHTSQEFLAFGYIRPTRKAARKVKKAETKAHKKLGFSGYQVKIFKLTEVR